MSKAAVENGREELKKFTQALLKDVKALEIMLDRGLIESGVERIGAEQELCLIDQQWNAAPLAMELLEHIKDPRVVNEFARFNLEINADPFPFTGDCFTKLENQLNHLLELIREAGHVHEVDVVLAGILPTLRQSDLTLDNMTPLARYAQLNDKLAMMRCGDPFNFCISGTDELITRHPSALLESCNTSFQVHLQVSPDQFAEKFNFAQLISGPLLAATSNSAMLFGKRLWKETRIALFQQSIDTRQDAHSLREQSPRVTFGKGWIEKSVTEIFQDDLSRFRMIIHDGIEEDALETLKNGGVPDLKALRLFNGTVYRWNRACYGISEGKPHLRIENRILPSGPTVVDEVANSAFWLGMMKGLPEKYRNLKKNMSFENAQYNFFKAARMGLDTNFTWLNEQVISASELILEELLPIARDGLDAAGVNPEDSQRLLGIITSRVEKRHTGSLWMIESFNKLLENNTRYEAAVGLTASMASYQKKGTPVHQWQLASGGEAESWRKKYTRVEQIMSTDLYTVGENDLVDLAAHIMEWKKIRHVPVENDFGHLIGVVTARTLMRRFAGADRDIRGYAVSEIMIAQPIAVSPSTLTTDALEMMKKHRVSCLPVVDEGKLVGMITEYDFTQIASELLLLMRHWSADKSWEDGK